MAVVPARQAISASASPGLLKVYKYRSELLKTLQIRALYCILYTGQAIYSN
jgi:hypothetical protein